MKREPIFSAVVGNSVTLGFFEIYPDHSCVWEYGKQRTTGTVDTGTLKIYLKIAQEEGKKHIRGAQIQEYFYCGDTEKESEAI